MGPGVVRAAGGSARRPSATAEAAGTARPAARRAELGAAASAGATRKASERRDAPTAMRGRGFYYSAASGRR